MSLLQPKNSFSEAQCSNSNNWTPSDALHPTKPSLEFHMSVKLGCSWLLESSNSSNRLCWSLPAWNWLTTWSPICDHDLHQLAAGCRVYVSTEQQILSEEVIKFPPRHWPIKPTKPLLNNMMGLTHISNFQQEHQVLVLPPIWNSWVCLCLLSLPTGTNEWVRV